MYQLHKTTTYRDFKRRIRAYGVILIVVLTLTTLYLREYNRVMEEGINNLTAYRNAVEGENKRLRAQLETLTTQYSQLFDILGNTPMKGAIPDIINVSNTLEIDPMIFVGIAFAESSFRNYNLRCYNPFGMSSNNEIICYKNWGQSIQEFGSLIKNNYLDKGLNTLELICPKWIGVKYAQKNCLNWIKNIKVYY